MAMSGFAKLETIVFARLECFSCLSPSINGDFITSEPFYLNPKILTSRICPGQCVTFYPSRQILNQVFYQNNYVLSIKPAVQRIPKRLFT